MFKPNNKVMKFAERITQLLYIQLIWLLFIAVGMIFGGIFPATATMLAVIRKWIMQDDEFPIFKTAWGIYMKSFWKVNILGYCMFLLGFSIYFYIYYFSTTSIILLILAIMIAILYIVTTFYIIPVYVHFNITLLDVIKHACIMALVNPMHTVAMILSLIGFKIFIGLLPAVVPFIGFSLFAYIFMHIANSAFKNVEYKVNYTMSK